MDMKMQYFSSQHGPDYCADPTSRMGDSVHHGPPPKQPSYYADAAIEPFDVYDTWPAEQRIGAYRAGLLKYVMRLGTKDERLKEAEKAAAYAAKLVEALKCST